jgi:hypothetical protein
MAGGAHGSEQVSKRERLKNAAHKLGSYVQKKREEFKEYRGRGKID